MKASAARWLCNVVFLLSIGLDSGFCCPVQGLFALCFLAIACIAAAVALVLPGRSRWGACVVALIAQRL
eukprot:9383075-Pyramimonas_sp.AAC.1